MGFKLPRLLLVIPTDRSLKMEVLHAEVSLSTALGRLGGVMLFL